MHIRIPLHIQLVFCLPILALRVELLTSIPSSQFSAIVDVAGDNIDEDKDPTKSSSSCIIREHLILWQPSWELSFRTLYLVLHSTPPSAVLNMSHQYWPPPPDVAQVLGPAFI